MLERLHLRACRVSAWLHATGHRAEHSLHLAYFAGLSTGLVDYHLVAAVCLLAGLAALLPAGAAVE
jgi:hypothetical protein